MQLRMLAWTGAVLSMASAHTARCQARVPAEESLDPAAVAATRAKIKAALASVAGKPNAADAKLVDAASLMRTSENAMMTLHQSALTVFTDARLDPNGAADPWQLFANALTQKINGGAPLPGLELVTVPRPAQWNDRDYGRWRAIFISDAIPRWEVAYSPTPYTVTDGYETFLESISLPLPNTADQKAADRAKKEYLASQKELQKATAEIAKEYTNFRRTQIAAGVGEDDVMPYRTWMTKFGNNELQPKQNDFDQRQATYLAYVQRAYGGDQTLFRALRNFNDASYQVEATSEDGLTLNYRTFIVTPGLDDFIKAGRARVANNDPPEWTFTLDKNSSKYDFSSSHYKTGASISVGFFSFGGNAESSTTSVNTSDNEFSLAFSAVGLQAFDIKAGRWFLPNAVKAYKDGPFVPSSLTGKPPEFFGPNGQFNQMPSQIIVAFRPKVVLHLSAAEYQRLDTFFSGGGSVGVGPFSFGGSYNKSTTKIDKDAVNHTFTFEDKSDVPQIIAVVNSVLPDFK